MTDLRQACQAHADWLVQTTASLARIESPSGDVGALRRCRGALVETVQSMGGVVDAEDVPGGHLLARWGRPGPQVLLLGHFDTVWPVGTLAEMPVDVRDGRLQGPGTFDMKAGIAIATLAAAVAAPAMDRLGIRLLLTTDEEVGSRTSRALIEAEARASEAVLVFEPSLPGGVLKTGRKGVGTFTLDVEGIPAHAGIAPHDGASAITELAQQIVALTHLQAPELGTTVNVGVISGGTRTNVVAAHARAEIDIRVSAQSEQARLAEVLGALSPVDPRVRLRCTGGFERPPLERGPHVSRLFDRAVAAGGTLGLDVREGATGGASDGNFTAALGIPTLDGLGAIGDGAHARHEHVEIASLPDRAALSAALLIELDRG